MSVCTVPVPVPATGFLLFTHSQSGTERRLPVGHHSACVVVRHNHRLCLSLGGADLREMRIWARKTGKRPIKNKNDTKETTSHEIVRKLFFLVVFRRCDRFAFVRTIGSFVLKKCVASHPSGWSSSGVTIPLFLASHLHTCATTFNVWFFVLPSSVLYGNLCGLTRWTRLN